MSAESIWENYKNTPSFVEGILDACKEMSVSPGDVEVIDTTWADNPVQVEVNVLDDGSGMVEIRPCFFGETLSDMTPVTAPLETPSASMKP